MTRLVTPVPAYEPDLETVPRRVDRATGAELVTRHFFPTSARSLENWELEWLIVNGKATCDTAALFVVAQAKLDAARSVRTGPRRKTRAAVQQEAA
jgi:hypothetical protein